MDRHNFTQIPLRLSFQKILEEGKTQCRVHTVILLNVKASWPPSPTSKRCGLACSTWEDLWVKFQESNRGNVFSKSCPTPRCLHKIQVVCVLAHAACPLLRILQLHKLGAGHAEDRLHLDPITALLTLTTCNCFPPAWQSPRITSPKQLAVSASSDPTQILWTIICLSFLLAWASSEWLPPSCSRLGTWTTIWFWLKPDSQLGRIQGISSWKQQVWL